MALSYFPVMPVRKRLRCLQPSRNTKSQPPDELASPCTSADSALGSPGRSILHYALPRLHAGYRRFTRSASSLLDLNTVTFCPRDGHGFAGPGIPALPLAFSLRSEERRV